MERGYCQMIGGEPQIVQHLDAIFRSLAPGTAAAPRTVGATDEPSQAEYGYLHCGPNGAGHFVKMVHNGIEYGLMAAYSEGLNILKNANAGRVTSKVDAETAPLRNPELYRFDFDIAEITEVWRRGSVIGSWLLDLTASALRKDPELAGFEGHVADSGEGRWTLQAAIDEGVPVPVLSAALFERFESRGWRITPIGCCRRCDSNSAAMSRRPRRKGHLNDSSGFRCDRLLWRHGGSRQEANFPRAGGPGSRRRR